jgi:hypothetical protein
MELGNQTDNLKELNFKRFDGLMTIKGSWGSPVSIVSDYRLATGVRFPAEAKDFSSSLCVQTTLRPTQPPIQWVPGILSLCVTLTTHPHLVPRSRMSMSYTSSPPQRLLKITASTLVLLCEVLYARGSSEDCEVLQHSYRKRNSVL